MKLVVFLLLPFIGEMGWSTGDTHTCLYKRPDSAQIYFLEIKKDVPCPKEVVIKDESNTRSEIGEARYTL